MWVVSYRLLKMPESRELLSLIEKAQGGDISARNEVVLATRYLIGGSVKQWQVRCPNLPVQDAYQNGFFGLLKAIEKFDPEKEFKFATFAKYPISNAIRAGVRKDTKYENSTVLYSEEHNEINERDYGAFAHGAVASEEHRSYGGNPLDTAAESSSLGSLRKDFFLALEGFSEETKLCVTLHLSGSTYKEISRKIGGLTPKAVGVRFRTAIPVIRARISGINAFVEPRPFACFGPFPPLVLVGWAKVILWLKSLSKDLRSSLVPFLSFSWQRSSSPLVSLPFLCKLFGHRLPPFSFVASRAPP